MDNGQVYDFVVTILRKEKNGSALDPTKFNLMLYEGMWEKLNSEYRRFELSQIITDCLISLKTSVVISITSGGEYLLDGLVSPNEYWHPTSLNYDDSGTIRKIEIVTDLEFNERISSSLLLPDGTYPIAKFCRNTSGDEIIKFDPLASVSVNFDYLKIPVTPFYDYYINANDEIIYMSPGTDHTLTAGEIYRDGTSSGLVSSISVELPFPDSCRIEVAYLILEKLGIPIREQFAVEYGITRENKEEQL